MNHTLNIINYIAQLQQDAVDCRFEAANCKDAHSVVLVASEEHWSSWDDLQGIHKIRMKYSSKAVPSYSNSSNFSSSSHQGYSSSNSGNTSNSNHDSFEHSNNGTSSTGAKNTATWSIAHTSSKYVYIVTHKAHSVIAKKLIKIISITQFLIRCSQLSIISRFVI